MLLLCLVVGVRDRESKVKHLKLLTLKTEKECVCVYVPCVFLAEEEKFLL